MVGFLFVLKISLNILLKKNPVFESDVLPNISKNKQVVAYKHTDFWQPLDTLRDYKKLKNLWDSKKAPWKIWK